MAESSIAEGMPACFVTVPPASELVAFVGSPLDTFLLNRAHQIYYHFVLAAMVHLPKREYNPLTLRLKFCLNEQESAEVRKHFEERGYQVVISAPGGTAADQGYVQKLDFYIPVPMKDAEAPAAAAEAEAAAAAASETTAAAQAPSKKGRNKKKKKRAGR